MFKKNKKEIKEEFERLEFPEVTDAAKVFGGYPKDWFTETLAKAHEEGIDGYTSNKWDKRFGELFFVGGKLNLNHDLDEDYLRRGVAMFKTVASSFEPKHEHKTAVCALILRSIEG